MVANSPQTSPRHRSDTVALPITLNRPWVAAAAVYSAPDPFSALFNACTQTPVAVAPAGDGQAQVFNPHVPLRKLCISVSVRV